MKIRLPNTVGRKLYFKCRKWEIRQQFTTRPPIRIESKFYTYSMKLGKHGTPLCIGVKYYLILGGKKND